MSASTVYWLMQFDSIRSFLFALGEICLSMAKNYTIEKYGKETE